MISFLSPLFLAGAVAAAIPIVLHLLRREPEIQVRFTAVKLLTHAPVERSARRHLRELLLLAMRVAALVLLALAFARPFVPAGAVAPAAGVTVIALDTSLSLSAPGQLERARAQARQRLAQVPSGDLAAVITFDDEAQVVAAPSLDRGAAGAAIDRVMPGFGATRYAAAIAAAATLFDGRRGSVAVVTDLQESGWHDGDSAALPDSAALEVIGIAPPPPNLAVTAARMSGDRVVATISGWGDRPRDARVSLLIDGKPAGDAIAAVTPGVPVEVTLPAAPGRAAAVSVEDAAGIQGDNTRYLLRNAGSRARVLVISASGDLAREALYFQHALAAGGASGTTHEVEGVGAPALAGWGAERLSRFVAVALLSTRGLDRNGRDLLVAYVASGGGLFVPVGPDIDAQVLADAVDGRLLVVPPPPASPDQERALTPADARHPVFRAFGGRAASLGLATFRRIATVTGEGCATLARFTTGETALMECESGSGRVIALASDVNNAWNNFPLHTSFVPFLQETVAYLGGRRPARGEYTVAEAPAGAPKTPGIVTVPGSTDQVAVNVDAAESNPSRLEAGDFEAAVTRLKDTVGGEATQDARSQEDTQRVWQYLLALMIGMLVLESFVGTRTA